MDRLAGYNFTGGNNDADHLPVDAPGARPFACSSARAATLATYGLGKRSAGLPAAARVSGGQAQAHAGIVCTGRRYPGHLRLAAGARSGQRRAAGARRHRLIEQDSYQGSINRLTRLGVNPVGIPLDSDGMRIDALADALDDLKRRGIRPKYIYTIPTVQNPTGTIMREARRAELLRLSEQHGVPIFEDDCYSDLIWDGKRPPALYAMSKHGSVIHIGSFSKSIAPALRVGYIVAGWDILSRMLAIKTDAGSGALEQMVLAEYLRAAFRRARAGAEAGRCARSSRR